MSNQVAITIRQQLLAGGKNQIKVFSWGAKAWRAGEDFLQFRVTGLLFRGVVRITLNSMDLYDVKLMKVSGEVVKEINGLYNDQLTDVIDEAVEKIPNYRF